MIKVDLINYLPISSPYSAYILGFLWSDSYIFWKHNDIRLEINSEDFNIIEPIFDLAGPWNKQHRNRSNRKPQSTFRTASKELCNFLKLMNYENKKNQCPNLDICDSLLHYWYRGLSDGDGCFYINKKNYLKQFSIGSSYEQDWSYITNKFNNLNWKIKRRISKKSKNSIIRLCNKRDIKEFGEYIYQGEQFGLIRKKEKWLEIIQ